MTAVRVTIAAVCCLTLYSVPTGAAPVDRGGTPGLAFDRDEALQASQAAVGRDLADYRFRDASGRTIRISDFSGRPVLINMVYTSCSYYCPVTSQALSHGIRAARDALGEDSFAVLTVGFDSRNDNPVRMRSYARTQGIDMPNWHFVAADAETVLALTAQLGFTFRPAPQGFDHLAQTTLVDGAGRIARQIYGADLTVPQIVEPLKRLRAGQAAGLSSIGDIVERIRLFCTLYDPDHDAYRFDWSFFIGLGIGLLSITLLAAFLANQFLLYLRTRP